VWERGGGVANAGDAVLQAAVTLMSHPFGGGRLLLVFGRDVIIAVKKRKSFAFCCFQGGSFTRQVTQLLATCAICHAANCFSTGKSSNTASARVNALITVLQRVIFSNTAAKSKRMSHFVCLEATVPTTPFIHPTHRKSGCNIQKLRINSEFL
jgi:hypothetical protein